MGQADFHAGHVTLKDTCAMGKGLVNPSSNINLLIGNIQI